MVSKIAVIALVAIVACPILLGYAMNLTETTETGYKPSGESVNVTPLLQNGEAYTDVHGDPYTYNTDFSVQYYNQAKIIPVYESMTTVRSSLPYDLQIYDNWTPGGATDYMSSYSLYYAETNYNISDGSLTGTLGYTTPGGITVTQTVSGFHSVYYKEGLGEFYYTYYAADGHITHATGNGTLNTVTISGSIPVQLLYGLARKTGTMYYVDLAAGFHFLNQPNDWVVNLPEHTHSATFTINLDSITDSSYSINMRIKAGVEYILAKTTTAGVVSWSLRGSDPSSPVYDLYYDPSRSDNTYQFTFNVTETDVIGSTGYYNYNLKAKYVGGWPTLIGVANAYQTYEFNDQLTYTYNPNVDRSSVDQVRFYNSNNNLTRSPTMRVDDAYFSAFQYPIIQNQLYDPAQFKTNPVTTISDVNMYGSSLSFGGNTYQIYNGYITLSGHNVPLKGMQLSSVLNENGTYDNMIGKTLVSTTASPSTITFNGSWAASISTQSMESFTYTKTQWNAGDFAWDGMDQNFLIVGLITCLGVFVALGIYARKRGTGGIIPLMIVTGCAAALFFIML